MTHHQMVLSEWIDRCTMRLGALLPTVDPAEVAERAAELRWDAYGFLPEDAAAILAAEMPGLAAGSICDYASAPDSSWVLACEIEGAADSERAIGLRAAQAVLKSAGVTPFEAAHSQFMLEAWDDSGFPLDMQLTRQESDAQQAWTRAWNAACLAVFPDRPLEQPRVDIEAHWPSKVRFEAARRRWLARQANDN